MTQEIQGRHALVIVSEKAIFFDVVGTLFKVRGGVGHVYASRLKKYGVDVTPEQIDDAFAISFPGQPPLAFNPGLSESERRKLEQAWWRSLVKEVLGQYGAFPRFDEYFNELFDYFKYANAWELCENTVNVLEDLSQAGFRLGIISNFDSRIDDVLRELDLARYFSSVHISSRVGAAKPNIEIFKHAIRAANLPAHQCWHIGDSLEEDFEGARRAGMRAALVRCTAFRSAEC